MKRLNCQIGTGRKERGIKIEVFSLLAKFFGAEDEVKDKPKPDAGTQHVTKYNSQLITNYELEKQSLGNLLVIFWRKCLRRKQRLGRCK
ncbi:MAG TPA: hypothetical protein VEP71_04860, partial [Gallionella sp.]|nr:hypothetical protein [Gallionella sp.]